MLELRLTADPKRIASMREAVGRECRRMHAAPDHAEAVALLTEQLVSGAGRRRGRSSEVFVIVTVQSDATMLMIRDPRPVRPELGDQRRQVLEAHTSRWSTMSGRDGRTIWAEIPRAKTALLPAPPRRLPCAP